MSITKHVLVIQTDGSYDYLDLPISYPAFAESFLDGWLEAIFAPRDGITFWFDEEGKFKALLPNRVATALYYALGGQLKPGDYLAGVVAVTGSDDQGEIDNVPDVADELKKVTGRSEHHG